MADRKERGEGEYTKIWISRERKELLDEMRNIFIVFEGLSLGEK